MLCLDFQSRRGLDEFCAELDRRVPAAGRRPYFAKESRTNPELIRAMYPRLAEGRRVRDAADTGRVFVADPARRLRLIYDEARQLSLFV